jgi:hypothetical protein
MTSDERAIMEAFRSVGGGRFCVVVRQNNGCENRHGNRDTWLDAAGAVKRAKIETNDMIFVEIGDQRMLTWERDTVMGGNRWRRVGGGRWRNVDLLRSRPANYLW